MKMLKQKFQARISKDMEGLSNTVFKKKWKMYYDKDMDVLYLTSPKLSEKHILFPMNEKNMSIRVDYAGKVEGVVIDNFWNFFAQENPEFKRFAKKMIKTALPNFVEVKKNINQTDDTKALIHEFCKSVLLSPRLTAC